MSPKLILIKSNVLHSFVCHCHKEPFWLIIPNVFNRASVDIYLFKFWFNFWYFNILWDFIACTINKPHQSYKVFFCYHSMTSYTFSWNHWWSNFFFFFLQICLWLQYIYWTFCTNKVLYAIKTTIYLKICNFTLLKNFIE